MSGSHSRVTAQACCVADAEQSCPDGGLPHDHPPPPHPKLHGNRKRAVEDERLQADEVGLMSFSTQDRLDWAFTRSKLTPELKLALIKLAFDANESGDGRIRLGDLCTTVQCERVPAIGLMAGLARLRLIVFSWHSSDEEDAANDVLYYGLCIDMGGAPP